MTTHTFKHGDVVKVMNANLRNEPIVEGIAKIHQVIPGLDETYGVEFDKDRTPEIALGKAPPILYERRIDPTNATMTIDEFRATRRYSDDLQRDVPEEVWEEDGDCTGWIYMAEPGLVIYEGKGGGGRENPDQHPDFEAHVVIHNDNPSGTLAECEQHLYDWALGEGYCGFYDYDADEAEPEREGVSYREAVANLVTAAKATIAPFEGEPAEAHSAVGMVRTALEGLKPFGEDV